MPNIEAHFLPGKGETLIITFNEMWNHYADQRFWGEKPLKKSGFPAFGITSDGPHWYPLHETIRAMRQPVREARRYKNVVLYGYSMGAYAALKYSWLFENPIILAFSPQFSIDPADVGPDDIRYSEFHNAAERVLKIEMEDTNGTGYIFYDPTYPVDAAHVRQIPAPQIHIPVHNCGHETIQCIRSSDALKAIIEAAVVGDHNSVKKLVRSGKRRNSFYAKWMLIKLLEKGSSARAANVAEVLYESYSSNPEILAIAADALKRASRYEKAISYYQRAFQITKEEKYITWANQLSEDRGSIYREKVPSIMKKIRNLF